MKSVARSCALAFAVVLPAQAEVDELMHSLTLPQKAGQLFMSWSLSRSEGEGDANNHARMVRWVREAELGGVILSLGTVEDAAGLIPKLQAAAKVPLLLAGDFEGGVWFRLQGATELGNQMLIGATRSPWLAEQAGRVTGEEARALGFHWVFAPVLDVNSNPDNPIINVRSFGEDPDLVARLGAAFARGVRSAGLLACGKHFPGHGDVDSDSHLELPTVPGDGERLRRVELHPFRVAAQQGLESVMTGHLAVPGLGEDPKVPATLSKLILGDVLRTEMGFTGLVVTDALEMGGVKNAFAPGEVAVRALLAGADVLLMPPDPLAARAAVVEAVASGRVPMARLDDAVRRILQAKAKVGLLSGGGMVDPAWAGKLPRDRGGAPENDRIAEMIAVRGMTLVRDRGELLPIEPLHDDAGSVLLVVLDQDDGADGELAEWLGSEPDRTFRVSSNSTAAEVTAAVAGVKQASRVVVLLFVKVREWSGGIGLPPAVRPVLAALQPQQDVVAVSFGNPYLIRDLPAVDTYLCTYVATAHTFAAARRALYEGLVLGRLPVSIPGVATAGDGLVGYDERPGAALPDFDPSLAARLRQRLEQAVADGAFPGAVVDVSRHGRHLVRVAVGELGTIENQTPVTGESRYDLASLTKVCATTLAVLRLVDGDVLALDDPVQKWLPNFTGPGKERVTIRHLLAHCSGLPSYVRFFRTMQGKAAIVDAAMREGLMVEPGVRTTYSDLGFMLLMAIVEAATGEPFDAFVQRAVFDPLGMESARFATTVIGQAAPTEHDPARGGIVRGLVHDENAFAMGGVSGHAGLFATVADVARVGRMMLSGGRGFLPRGLVTAATSPAGIVAGDTARGLGFQRLRPGSWAGTEVSPGAFGHTGFTGTSLLCDPERDCCVVLLTNRVHPTRVNNKITAVRREVHDIVRAALRQ